MPVEILQPKFSTVDWLVVVAYLVGTTLIGAKLAGKQATIRDFFLGGRKLPWWAISGSIIATEISAATIVGVPTISYAAGGNLTYLQLALGSILARVIVARYFVRKFFEKEIYSPYDYVGARLGPRVKHTTTALFFLGAILGQGARLFITASVLGVVAGLKPIPAIWLMGAFAVGWTLLGGMTTVIWTDVIQFGVIILGAVFALLASVMAVPGGVGEVIRVASEAGKFQLFDFSTDLSLEYTFWCGIIALPFLNLAAFGTDQVMAQRMFCCKSEADARRAILWSNVSLFIPVLMLGVGIAMYAYFLHRPLSPDEAAQLTVDKQRLFPLFILRELPVGVRGIVVAAIFAASISTLEGALTALAQATVGFFLKPSDLSGEATPANQRRATSAVRWSKLVIIAWGLLLCLMAMACIELAKDYKNVIDLALSLARYTYGPLLGVFLLAFLPRRRDDAGLFWGVGLSICVVLAMSLYRTGSGQPLGISPFWHYPIATGITFAVGYLLGKPVVSDSADFEK